MSEPSSAPGPQCNTTRDESDPRGGLDGGTTGSPAITSTVTGAAGPPVGDSAARLSWLRDELGRQLGVYRRRRKRDKRKAFGLQMATVTLSATITVLLGLRAAGAVQERLADVALALGAMITVLAAAEAFFAHRGMWILRTETVRDLETLARRMDYYQAGIDGPPDPAALERFRVDLDRILATDLTAWQHLRAATPSGAPDGESTGMGSAGSPPPAAAQYNA